MPPRPYWIPLLFVLLSCSRTDETPLSAKQPSGPTEDSRSQFSEDPGGNRSFVTLLPGSGPGEDVAQPFFRNRSFVTLGEDVAQPFSGPKEDSPPRGTVGGEYYCGDGLGFNLSLTLNQSGRFECTWTGCLGVYGKAQGNWAVEGERVVFQPETATGRLREYLSHADIVKYREHLLLVLEKHKEFYEPTRPSADWCLHRDEARYVLGW